jgi:hypothetical protein
MMQPNQGYANPYDMAPVQFSGQQGMGYPPPSNLPNEANYTTEADYVAPESEWIQAPESYRKAFGGMMEYQDGGEYLSDQEIQNIISAGGQVEYL